MYSPFWTKTIHIILKDLFYSLNNLPVFFTKSILMVLFTNSEQNWSKGVFPHFKRWRGGSLRRHVESDKAVCFYLLPQRTRAYCTLCALSWILLAYIRFFRKKDGFEYIQCPLSPFWIDSPEHTRTQDGQFLYFGWNGRPAFSKF